MFVLAVFVLLATLQLMTVIEARERDHDATTFEGK